MKKTVYESTVKYGLCISCGICEAICPQQSIKLVENNGQYIPNIEMSKCIYCGTCSDICSAHKMEFSKYINLNQQTISDDWFTGSYLKCYNGYSLDNDIRLNATSGGLITTIVKILLENKIYDNAFLVDDFNYGHIVESNIYSKSNELDKTSKSRYIPISHKNMVTYAIKNKNKKLIIVATSCVIHTFLNVILKYKLNRTNYLLLGLFCDRTLNQNIYRYFQDYVSYVGRLNNLYFRTKEKNGWPGDIKCELHSGESLFIPKEERIKMKDYFQLERCLYCIDKLNQFADISFGDNYTNQNADGIKGSNSIIVRTEKGKEIINNLKENIKLYDVDISVIKDSQKMSAKTLNFEFAKILFMKQNINLYPDFIKNNGDYKINKKIEKILKRKKKNIEIGKIYPKSKNYLNMKLKITNFKINIIKRLMRTWLEKKN